MIPIFDARALPVTSRELPYTYRSGCPVTPDQMTKLEFSHVDFEDRVQTGTLIVSTLISDPVLEVLEVAFRERYPIAKAVPVDDPAYRGDDNASMADNNSSCFNYRPIAGTDRLSRHSLGLAVDINPALNPYLTRDGMWLPDDAYANRTNFRRGMFDEKHPVVQAFIQRGFEWGGSWDRPDYHHFEYRDTVLAEDESTCTAHLKTVLSPTVRIDGAGTGGSVEEDGEPDETILEPSPA